MSALRQPNEAEQPSVIAFPARASSPTPEPPPKERAWAKMPHEIMCDPRLEPIDVLVLGAALYHARRALRCWPSDDTMAEYARCSSKTVSRALGRLEAAGYIRREKVRPTGANMTGRILHLSFRENQTGATYPPWMPKRKSRDLAEAQKPVSAPHGPGSPRLTDLEVRAGRSPASDKEAIPLKDEKEAAAGGRSDVAAAALSTSSGGMQIPAEQPQAEARASDEMIRAADRIFGKGVVERARLDGYCDAHSAAWTWAALGASERKKKKDGSVGPGYLNNALLGIVADGGPRPEAVSKETNKPPDYVRPERRGTHSRSPASNRPDFAAERAAAEERRRQREEAEADGDRRREEAARAIAERKGASTSPTPIPPAPPTPPPAPLTAGQVQFLDSLSAERRAAFEALGESHRRHLLAGFRHGWDAVAEAEVNRVLARRSITPGAAASA